MSDKIQKGEILRSTSPTKTQNKQKQEANKRKIETKETETNKQTQILGGIGIAFWGTLTVDFFDFFHLRHSQFHRLLFEILFDFR